MKSYLALDYVLLAFKNINDIFITYRLDGEACRVAEGAEGFWFLKEGCLCRLAAVAVKESSLRAASGVGSEGRGTGVPMGFFCILWISIPSPNMK